MPSKIEAPNCNRRRGGAEDVDADTWRSAPVDKAGTEKGVFRTGSVPGRGPARSTSLPFYENPARYRNGHPPYGLACVRCCAFLSRRMGCVSTAFSRPHLFGLTIHTHGAPPPFTALCHLGTDDARPRLVQTWVRCAARFVDLSQHKGEGRVVHKVVGGDRSKGSLREHVRHMRTVLLVPA